MAYHCVIQVVVGPTMIPYDSSTAGLRQSFALRKYHVPFHIFRLRTSFHQVLQHVPESAGPP